MNRRHCLAWFALILILLLSCVIIRSVSRLDTQPNCSLPLQSSLRISNQTVPFLIIVAEARSGSTWLESFFKENERVLDFFEPLDGRAVKSVIDMSDMGDADYTQIKLSILSNECQCQFSNVKYPSLGERASWSKSLHRLQGYLDDQGVVLPQYRKSKSTDLKATLKAAIPKDLGSVERLCRNLDLITAKVVRLKDLSTLRQLPDLGCTNFKIIHLIRDPRPIMQSRMDVFGELQTGNGAKSSEFEESAILSVARDMCENYLYNLNIGLKMFRDNYKVVKYEDIASDPIEYGRALYRFAGLEFSKDVQDYIEKSSSGSVVNGKYEVVRNTAEVVEKWKEIMDSNHVKLVESQCYKMMRTFGYNEL